MPRNLRPSHRFLCSHPQPAQLQRSAHRTRLPLCSGLACLSFVLQPTDANLPAYLAEFQSHNVTDVVRACEGCYAIERLTAAGIEVVELPFEDGSPPPDHVIDAWLDLVNARFTRKERNADGAGTIAVHCVAGLGRAPVLVAIALIERGAEPLEAVELIRSKRRGAINQKQLAYLEHGYKRRSGGCCVLM